jgi:hypothetical protein
MAEVNMVVVNGIRYRAEDAPKQAVVEEPVESKAAEKPNKARPVQNKSGK